MTTINASKVTYASSAPRQATFLVYINGLEVPAKSASMRSGVWQIPEMQVEMVADPVLQRLGAEDRVQVVVFYLDDCDVAVGVEPQFRLFGEGEITGWGFRNTSSGRSIVFTVVNQIAVFTQLFVQFMTTLDDMIGHATGPSDVTGVATPSSQLVYPFALFQQGLMPGAGDAPTQITRPFEFLYNCVRGMISSRVPTAQQTVPASNFFARWARLTNFHNRFMATPFFDEVVDNANIFPVLRALQNVSAVDVITKNLIPQIQNAGTIWDTIQMVYVTMLMEVAMIPAMPLVTVDLASGLVQETNFAEHKLVESFGSWVSSVSPESRKTKPKRIPSYFAKPQSLFGVPPACNVVFPSQLKTIAYDENYATQPTRLYYNDETTVNILKMQKSGLTTAINNALATGYPPEVDAATQAHEKFPSLNSKNFLLYPEEFFKGPVMYRSEAPPWLFFLKQQENKKAPTTQNADGGVPTPPAPAQTAYVPAPTPAPSTAGSMNTKNDVGIVGAGGQRVYTQGVEALRGKANKFAATTGIPVDLQLAWVSNESQGKLDETTVLNERGYFQIMGPHTENGKAVPLAQTEAGRILGLTIADTGADQNAPPGAARLSIDSDFSYAQGIRLVQAYRQIANQAAVQFSLSWTDGDMWRLTKLYHNAPAFVFGGTPQNGIVSFIADATHVLGHPPVSWEEMYKAVAGHATPFGLKVLNNATAVGGVVAGSSGTMTTERDKAPIKSPTASAAPSTPQVATSKDAPPVPAATPTTVPPSTYDAAVAAHETVYQLYAKYEYFRERYAKRNGSATIAWNPYVVPGFSGAIFDERASRVDLLCYITTVQQQMSNEGTRATTLSFLYGRQFQEMFDLMALEFSRDDATARGSAPQEPIRDVSKIVQSFSQAETYYQRLFYGAQRLFGKDAAFDFRKIIGYAPVEPGGTPEPIFVDGPDEATEDSNVAARDNIATLVPLRDQAQAAILDLQSKIKANQQIVADIPAPSGTIEPEDLFGTVDVATRQQALDDITTQQLQLGTLQTQVASLNLRINTALSTVQSTENTSGAQRVLHNLVADRELVPLPSAQAMFESRDAAMRYNWRPICTLDEYIVFHNSAGQGVIPAFGHPQSVGVRYYDRIRQMTPAPDNFVPPAGATGLGTTSVPGLNSATFPQTREDWDKALIAYKQNVLTVKAPRV
jgi:hypothetical protein